MTERQWMGLCLACNDAGLTTDLAVKLQVLELIEEEMEAEPSLPHRMMLLDAGHVILDQLAEGVSKRRSHLDDLAHGVCADDTGSTKSTVCAESTKSDDSGSNF